MAFKNSILGDPRVAYIGANYLKMQFEESIYGTDSNDSTPQYNAVAQIMGFMDMTSILEIFIEKILYTLVYTDGTTEEGKLNIEFSLANFDGFIT